MALGDIGHHSSQTMQGVAMAQGRQRPRSKKAVPMRMGGVSSSPTFSSKVNSLDGAGGADLAAKGTGGLAVSDLRDQVGGPEPLEPGLQKGRVQRVVRAHPHALATPDAALQEVLLGEGARGPNQEGGSP